TQGDRTIKRLARNGGVAVTVCRSEAVYGMSWSDHGIVFGQLSKGIMRVAASGGEPELIAAAEPGEIATTPWLLPDGKAVIIATRLDAESWENGSIVVQERGGPRVKLIDGGADPRLLPGGRLAFARAGSVFMVPFDERNRRVTGGPVPMLEGVRRGSVS